MFFTSPKGQASQNLAQSCSCDEAIGSHWCSVWDTHWGFCDETFERLKHGTVPATIEHCVDLHVCKMDRDSMISVRCPQVMILQNKKTSTSQHRTEHNREAMTSNRTELFF